MTQPQQSPYNQADLIQLIGQATVELAFLRGQVAQLQQRVAELDKTPDNGIVHPVAEVVSPA